MRDLMQLVWTDPLAATSAAVMVVCAALRLYLVRTARGGRV